MTKQTNLWAVGGLLGLLAACGSNKAAVKVDDGALAKLNEQQMQPVDDARIEEGRARDQLARARLAVQDAKAKVDVSKAERDVAVAQQNRAKAEHDMLTRQKADTADIMRAQLDAQNGGERIKATDMKLDYLHRMVDITQLEEQLAAQHAEVAKAITDRAKFKALEAAKSNEVRGINPAEVDARLADAQQKEANLRKHAADKRVELVEIYNKWQEVDARMRSVPERAITPPPAPTSPSEPQR